MVENEELGDYALAERTLRRLVRDYPDFDRLPEAYYQLFLLARRGGKQETADKYRAIMARSYPHHVLTRTITDPDFERNARYGRELEDSLYAATYAAYLNGQNDEVARNFVRSSSTYPEGLNRPKFLLVHALSRIGTAPRDTLIAEFSTLAKDFPKSDVAEMAAMMAKGLKEGRTPAGGKYRPGSLWERRLDETTAENAAEGDKRTLSPERNVPFVFVVAYPTDSLPDDKILYELARFNFSRFVSRGLDINKQQLGALTLFRVDGFCIVRRCAPLRPAALRHARSATTASRCAHAAHQQRQLETPRHRRQLRRIPPILRQAFRPAEDQSRSAHGIRAGRRTTQADLRR